MRKPLFCSSIKVEDMTSPNQSFDVVGESRVERVRKILTSPLTKKKTSNPDRIFGIPLEELVRRAPQGSQEVPLVVSRICEYIEHHGFHHEGLFRVSASARVVDKLRALFDRNGDANLEDVGDVMAAAGLLKLFLRSLPEAVIPSHFLCQFVCVQEEHRQDNEECIRQLKKLVEQLPEENFNLLKYLMSFLLKVTISEEYNRMNAAALGIIFGPNIFRVSEGEDCLKEQSITNQVVTKFIKHYSAIFEADTNALQPKRTPCAIRKQNVLVASRPSPPKALSGQNQFEMDMDYRSGPKGVRAKASALHEHFLPNRESSGKGAKMANGTCSDDLPLPTKLTSKLSLENQENQFVELPDCNNHSHGEFSFAELYDPPRPPPRIKHKKMDLSPDGAALSKLARSNSEEAPKIEAPAAPHMLVVRKCSSQENVLGAEGLMDSSPSPVTTSLEDQLENVTPSKKESFPLGFSCRQDHPLTPLNIDTSLQATPDLRMKDWSRHYDSETDVSEARRSAERLQYRATSSKSRRMPALKSSRRCVSMEVMRNAAVDESRKENEIKASSKSSRKQHQKRACPIVLAENPAEAPEDDPMQDVSAAAKPRLWLLDLHAAASANHERGVEDGASPCMGNKSYVPPLDFSILHEHGDGSDPIPTNQLRASWPFSHCHNQDGDDDVMLSPRTCPLDKKSGYDNFLMDHNIPPSPPLEQEVGRKSSSMKDDGCGDPLFKVLNKRISALKRKIKKFEDGFEDESGYRPSHSEKMCRSDIKKYMSDLVKARKELKQLKEEMRMAAVANSCLLTSQGTGGTKSSSHRASGSHRLSTLPFPTMEESLDEMMKKLNEKRHLASRPEGLEEMNREQVLEEKLAIQKSLLHFENLHGHPSTKVEKELMKPIYERYRNVKRLAAKASSPKMKESGMELQPIIEHQTMDFTQASPKHSCQTAETNEQHVEEDKEDSANGTPVSSLDDPEMDNLMSPTHRKSEKKLADSCSLHELSHDELIEQEWKVRCEKKRLRRILKEFEEEFQRQNGRKAQREDRSPMDAVYMEYKQVKAKLKLLEALLTKHEHHYTI